MSSITLDSLRTELQIIKKEILHELMLRSEPQVCFPGAGVAPWCREQEPESICKSTEGMGSSMVQFMEAISEQDASTKLDGGAGYKLLGHRDSQTDSEPDSRLKSRQRIWEFATSNTFNNIITVAVFANVACIVFEVDYLARTWSEEVPSVLRIAEVVFLIIFTAEITIRICVFRLSFFSGPKAAYHWFDFTLVCMQLAEQVLNMVSRSVLKQAHTILALMRMLRIARILRVMRLVRLLPELHGLVRSIASCLKQLTSVSLLLVAATGVFAIVLTQIVTDHKLLIGRENMEQEEVLEEYFGSVGIAMLRLYMTISDGMHWAELVDPLMEFCSPWTSLIFVAYSAFVTIAMMNVVTAFCVETALRVAHDEALSDMSQQLWEAFTGSPSQDSQEDSLITEKDFVDRMSTPALRGYFEKLDLSVEQALHYKFFHLLDADGSGQISREELKDGCVRLIGSARAVDVAMLMFEYRQEMKRQADHRQQMQKALMSFNSVLLCYGGLHTRL